MINDYNILRLIANPIDLKILDMAEEKKIDSITTLVRAIPIAPKNLIDHIKKLERLRLIKKLDYGRGHKKIILLYGEET